MLTMSRNVESDLLQAFLNLQKIHKKLVDSYNPQSNGLSEGNNKPILQIMIPYVFKGYQDSGNHRALI